MAAISDSDGDLLRTGAGLRMGRVSQCAYPTCAYNNQLGGNIPY